MFEREIRDASFLKRWSIVRTIRDQTVAEHSFFVATYANDICVILGLSDKIKLLTLQYALWHDFRDEIFTGDLPGPSKRALVTDRDTWDQQLDTWSRKVFERLDDRMGCASDPGAKIAKLVVKLADWIDAAYEMATETQLGNMNCRLIATQQNEKAKEAAYNLFDALGYDREFVDMVPLKQDDYPEAPAARLLQQIEDGFVQCIYGDSRNPQITIQTL